MAARRLDNSALQLKPLTLSRRWGFCFRAGGRMRLRRRWSFQHSAPRIALVICTPWRSTALRTWPSIRQCLDRGCIHVVLCLCFSWNNALVTKTPNSEQRAHAKSNNETFGHLYKLLPWEKKLENSRYVHYNDINWRHINFEIWPSLCFLLNKKSPIGQRGSHWEVSNHVTEEMCATTIFRKSAIWL